MNPGKLGICLGVLSAASFAATSSAADAGEDTNVTPAVFRADASRGGSAPIQLVRYGGWRGGYGYRGYGGWRGGYRGWGGYGLYRPYGYRGFYGGGFYSPYYGYGGLYPGYGYGYSYGYPAYGYGYGYGYPGIGIGIW